ncbi:SDR family oxidoreductase [Amycolatopsis jejuensis]|uniref:SDR family oxidoreductase n=1 Tax=Amycolatopsis jejuensis TaxID=330084 RepID=UPI000691520B|nr:SDR family oxidoreductase [Amycolatopsis jejuensis]
MAAIAWLTGASSGIGAACAQFAPQGIDVTGVCRGIPAAGRHLAADLSRPDGWAVTLDDIEAHLSGVDEAYLLHLAGVTAPVGPVTTVDSASYLDSFLLNAGSTFALGQGFLQRCAKAGVRGTLVVCSSPSATDVIPGMSQYGAAKAAVEHWARIVAAEGSRVVAVVPYAVDTPMLRAVMDNAPEDDPLAGHFRELHRRGELASAVDTAEQIWAAALNPPADPVVAVGARHLAVK